MLVKVIKKHTYGGVERKPYEEYEMEERFLLPMTLMGNVVHMPIENRDLNAETQPKKYRRRDMKAEG